MSGFFDTSKEIAEDFLQTAVFLDDMDDRRNHESAEPPVEEINEPKGVVSAAGLEKEPQPVNSRFSEAGYCDTCSGKSDSSEIEGNKAEGSDFLDAQSIVDTFMKKGIVCSVIKCRKDYLESDEYICLIIRLIKKADIAVLDWDLYSDGGDKVKKIISKIASGDGELRLIVIYTYEDLKRVKETISKSFLGFEHANETDDYILHNKYTTVSLFSKSGGKSASTERNVEPAGLADKCIEEFTSAFRGIVPNVALSAISEIRKNTHRLLGVLNKDLDIGYLSHRALLPFPEDAEKHLEEIISDELGSIVSGSKVGEKSGYECIKDYEELKDKTYSCVVKNCKESSDKKVYFKDTDPSLCEYKIDFAELIKYGLDDFKKKYFCKTLKKKADEDSKKNFVVKWYAGNEKQGTVSYESKKDFSEDSEKQFAVLTILQNDYNPDKLKNLSLGVIIEKLSSNGCQGERDKFLCMQPECDSVRLSSTEPNEFIFVKLRKSDGRSFDLLLPEKNDENKIKFERYSVDLGRKFRRLISFRPSDDCGIVRSDEMNEFMDDDNCSYRYVGVLKKSHAQRIANRLGAKISRVGVNESEYLRRNQAGSEDIF